jgi:hypothetical protein
MNSLQVDFITYSCDTKITGEWYIHKDPVKCNHLNQGGAYFRSTCATGDKLDARICKNVNYINSLSSFENEEIDNNSPHINLFSSVDAAKYTFIVIKADYLVGCNDKVKLTPEHLSSMDYLSKCNPGNPLIQCGPEDTMFRVTREIIPYIQSISCQFKSSCLFRDQIVDLEKLEGHPIDYGILIERTKRNKNNVDYARKVKSVLLYTFVPGGFYVSHITIITNTQIPSFATSIVGQLAKFGYSDTSESTKRTRKYFDEKNNYEGLIKKVGKMPSILPLPDFDW